MKFTSWGDKILQAGGTKSTSQGEQICKPAEHYLESRENLQGSEKKNYEAVWKIYKPGEQNL